MTNGLNTVAYLLLIFVDYLLKITFIVLESVIITLKTIARTVLNGIIMIEPSKKRKRNNEKQTVPNQGIISGNWKEFLSSNLIMDKKTEKPPTVTNDDHYTGPFRRARKKQAQDNITSNSVQNNLKTLNISSESLNKGSKSSLAANADTPTAKRVEKKNKLTKFIAMDCEMVGIGYDGNDHMLARVSLVNKFGDSIYDKFVKAREEVKDYRTDISGIRREDLLNGEEFTTVQKEVAEIIRGKVLVGHSLKNDLSVLFLSHPKRSIRDTAKYKPFRKITKGSTPSLKRLAKEILGIDIQHGEHSSVEDARAAMQLYCTVAKKWESTLSDKRGHSRISDD